MILLLFLAVASTGYIVVKSHQRYRPLASHGWLSWALFSTYPLRALLLWGWIFWMVTHLDSHNKIRITPATVVGMVLVLSLSGLVKLLDQNLRARLEQLPRNSTLVL